MKTIHFILLLIATALTTNSLAGNNEIPEVSQNTKSTDKTKVNNIPGLKLNNGVIMPQLGIGTYQLAEGDVSKNAVLTALRKGYRHIDTAHAYGNERSIGQAVKESAVPRDSIWITSKLWPNEYGEGKTLSAIDKMLKRLGVDYIDLVYLHQPVGDYMGAWSELEKAVKQGKVRAIGISNFDYNDTLFDNFYAKMKMKPVAMQIECHPYAQRKHWQEKLKALNIVLECWFPLGGRESNGKILRDSTINHIALAHGKSAAQIILRWEIQEGFSTVPGTDNPDYISENIDVFDFSLSNMEMQAIRNLNTETRFFNMTLEQVQDRFGKFELND
jgi:Aldo/keto reductases, related to diketogulonate reductase